LNDKLIRRTTRDLMWTPLKPSDGSADTYGLGWNWREEKDHGVANVGNIGGQQGTSAVFEIMPDRRVGVVVLTNMEGQPAADLADEILKILVAARKS
jgi:CubicO group peptidase (beta-lactamase class C family)